jgi:phage-related holin
MCAIVDKKLSSEVGFKGICRKVLIFIWSASQMHSTSMCLTMPECFGQRSSFSTSRMRDCLVENSVHLGLPVS